MKTYKHPSVIKLVAGIIDRIPVGKRGTYNQAQDATHYEKGKVTVDGYLIEWADYSIGEQLEVTKGDFHSKLYYDSCDKEVCDHGIAKGTFLVLLKLLPTLLRLYPSKIEQHRIEYRNPPEEDNLPWSYYGD